MYLMIRISKFYLEQSGVSNNEWNCFKFYYTFSHTGRHKILNKRPLIHDCNFQLQILDSTLIYFHYPGAQWLFIQY